MCTFDCFIFCNGKLYDSRNYYRGLNIQVISEDPKQYKLYYYPYNHTNVSIVLDYMNSFLLADNVTDLLEPGDLVKVSNVILSANTENSSCIEENDQVFDEFDFNNFGFEFKVFNEFMTKNFDRYFELYKHVGSNYIRIAYKTKPGEWIIDPACKGELPR